MAQFRQPGSDRFPNRSNHESDQLADAAAAAAAARIHLHHHHHKPATIRLRRHKRRCGLTAAAALTFLLLLLVALSASLFLLFPAREIQNRSVQVVPKTLRFGHVVDIGGGRDSRYWDGDDRRRDQDFNEVDDDVDSYHRSSGEDTKMEKESHNGGGGLYNEGGRKELDAYKREYEASEKNGGGSDSGHDDYDDGIDFEDEKEEEEEKLKIEGRENDEILEKNEKLVSSVVPRRIGNGGGRRRKDIGSQVVQSGPKRKSKRNISSPFV